MLCPADYQRDAVSEPAVGARETTMIDPKSTSPALRYVDARRVETHGTSASWTDEEVGVVVETPITIDVDGIETYTLLCTPLDTEALKGERVIIYVEKSRAIASLRGDLCDPMPHRPGTENCHCVGNGRGRGHPSSFSHSSSPAHGARRFPTGLRRITSAASKPSSSDSALATTLSAAV